MNRCLDRHAVGEFAHLAQQGPSVDWGVIQIERERTTSGTTISIVVSKPLASRIAAFKALAVEACDVKRTVMTILEEPREVPSLRRPLSPQPCPIMDTQR